VQSVAPDVKQNTDVKDRRVVVIVMDDATPMPMQEVPLAKAVARQIIEALGPNDLACVTYVLDRRSGEQFTTDRMRLLAAVDRFNGASEGPGVDEKGTFLLFIPFDKFNATVTTLYTNTLRLIQGTAEELAVLPARRKALVLVSVGIPMEAHAIDVGAQASGNVGNAEALRDVWRSVQAALEAARQANVTIYGLDPGGLRAPGSVKSADPLAPGRLNMDFLKTVSENTGGFAITDTNSPEPGIQQLLRENASYYLVGYQPNRTRTTGRFHRVEVKVNRPDVSVRSRKGHFDSAGDADSKAAPRKPILEEVAVIQGLLPKGDIALKVHAVPFAKIGGRESEVAIVLQGREPLAAETAPPGEDLVVLLHAYNTQAELKASERLTVHIGTRPGSVADLRYSLLSRLTLKPGRYQLRLAVKSAMLNKSGSVYAVVDVPDFSKTALSQSEVMFEAVPSPIAAPKGKLDSLIPIVPTAERDFAAGDTVTAFSRIYQGGKDALQIVAVTTRIVDRTGTEVFKKVETIAADRFAAGRSADVLVSVPVGTLVPGPHLLSITTTRGKDTASQQVRFSVLDSGR